MLNKGDEMIKKILMLVMMMCFVVGAEDDFVYRPEPIADFIFPVLRVKQGKGKQVIRKKNGNWEWGNDNCMYDTLLSPILPETGWYSAIELDKKHRKFNTYHSISTEKGMTKFIKILAKQGWICKTFGHQWEYGKEPNVVWIVSGGPVEFRKCKICGRKEVKKITWEER